MPQSYQLVLFNVVIASTIVSAWLFYRLIYPRKNIPAVITLLVFSSFPLFSIWRPGVPESGEFAFHTKALMAFYHALTEGVWLPHWAGNFCNYYGYPLFKFFYKLPYYLLSILHLAGLGFIDSLKLFLTLLFPLAGLSMFRWLKSEFSQRAALIGSLFYLYAPYQLEGLNFKHALGEALGLVLVPWLLLAVKRLIEEQKSPSSRRAGRWWLAVTLGYSLLVFSHHIVPIIILPLMAGYAWLVIWRQSPPSQFLPSLIRNMSWLATALAAALLLTTWHWLPIVWEGHLIQFRDTTRLEFWPLRDFLWARWKWGLLFQGKYGEISPLIGYTQLLVVVLGGWLFWQKKLTSRYHWLLGGSLLLWVGYFLLMQSWSQPLWQALPFFRYFQFSIRLLFVLIMINAVIAALVVEYLPPKWAGWLAVITVAYTCLNWGTRTMINDITDEITTAQIPGRCDQLAWPRWVDTAAFSVLLTNPHVNIEVVSGQAKIVPVVWSSQRHLYQIQAESSVVLRENTTYFPGWRVMDNGREIPITYDDPRFPGIIGIKLEPGTHQVLVEYVGTDLDRQARQISLLALGVIGIAYASVTYCYRSPRTSHH